MHVERFDTVVIGGGQAGLAVGYCLARRGRDFLILDAHARVGESWRRRWDSLRLVTSARLTRLPGLPFPARGPRPRPGWPAPSASTSSTSGRRAAGRAPRGRTGDRER